jgi:soluble lytic murein transglycosylase
VLPPDPQPTAADRARFQAIETVQAAEVAASAGLQNIFDLFVVASVEALPNPVDATLLVDLARNAGEQDLSMRVVRLAAQRGVILPERGYPVITPPASASVEPAMILGIVRQESGFDPRVRSGAGARGMMQLMPATAKVVARRSGVGYNVERLDQADYNMALGTTFLGSLVDEFDGSYLMAAAAYNAGPNRPAQWTAACGDPRGSSTDPVDYIECIPIAETRNYVMRVMEGMAVYKARLAGGHAPLTLAADLKRGGFGGPPVQMASASPTIDSLLEGSLGASADAEEAIVASTPVPNPPETAPLRLPLRQSSRGHGRPGRTHGRLKEHGAHHQAKARKTHK